MRPLLVALAATLIAGCAGTPTREALNRVDETTSEADSALASMRSGQVEREGGGVRILRDEYFVPSEPIDLNSAAPMPSCTITFAPASSVTLLEFGQTVTKVCGLAVRVTPDALAVTRGDRRGGGEQRADDSAGAGGLSSAGMRKRACRERVSRRGCGPLC